MKDELACQKFEFLSAKQQFLCGGKHFCREMMMSY